MRYFNGQYGFMADINVTPLVDVMLVLLIIFMITAPMFSYGPRVDLPETTSKPAPIEVEPLIITINNKSQIFLDRYQVPIKGLSKKLKPIIAAHPKRNVLLQADKKVAYGYVIKVIDEIRLSGIKNLGLVTKPLKKK
ncbi:MAG: hypothetical protein AMJ45_03430 [Syntrophobacter sp. DG_60]|nr:MAG: hypothetical protein AMJ45_03430 [Syntrophobacter sp. DG_60]